MATLATDSTPFDFPQSPISAPMAPADNAIRQGAQHDELSLRAQKYGVQQANARWSEATKSLNTADPAAVEGFAKQYGVTRGNVMDNASPAPGGTVGTPRPMTNDELLRAAQQKHHQQFHATTLLQDPNYQSILNGTHTSVQDIVARRQNLNPWQVQQNNAGVVAAQNTAGAIGSDAANRTTLANSTSGLQNANAQHLTQMTPYDQKESAARAGVMGAQAGKLGADALHTVLTTPGDVYQGWQGGRKTGAEAGLLNAETESYPAMVQNQAGQRDLAGRKIQSEIDLNGARQKEAEYRATHNKFGEAIDDGAPEDTGGVTPPAGTPAAPKVVASQPAPQPTAPPQAPAVDPRAFVQNPDGTFSHPGYPNERYQKVPGGYKKVAVVAQK